MPEFSVPVEFTEKTRAAMMAFARFLDSKRLSLERPHKVYLSQFQEYARKNQLHASKPGYCDCRHKISEAEVIFNECRTCQRKYLNDTI